MNINDAQYKTLSTLFAIPVRLIKTVVEVEASGSGFDPGTGKLKIQFEPLWFKRQFDDWKEHIAGHKWVLNAVGVQSVEWAAFNDAFGIDPTAAMESTSIGNMQVMGYHWKALGFASVGAMWDYAKKGEYEQIEIGLRFIKLKANGGMYRALINRNFATFASLYNGPKYKTYRYDSRLQTAYNSFKD